MYFRTTEQRKAEAMSPGVLRASCRNQEGVQVECGETGRAESAGLGSAAPSSSDVITAYCGNCAGGSSACRALFDGIIPDAPNLVTSNLYIV